jgi:hypothetical protein
MALPPRRERSLGLRCRHDQVERRATPLDASRGAASSQINGVDGKIVCLILMEKTESNRPEGLQRHAPYLDDLAPRRRRLHRSPNRGWSSQSGPAAVELREPHVVRKNVLS